jgi:hypothetical protein
MKYRVKFKCYHFNTGYADNGSYINHEDFDNIDDAIDYAIRVNKQLEMSKKYERNEITYDEYNKWEKSFDLIEIEDGVIEEKAEIVKYYPEYEEKIN